MEVSPAPAPEPEPAAGPAPEPQLRLVERTASVFELAAESGPPMLLVSCADTGPTRHPSTEVLWANTSAVTLLGLDPETLRAPAPVDAAPVSDWTRQVGFVVAGAPAPGPDWLAATISTPAVPSGQLLFRTQAVPTPEDPTRHLVWLRPAADEVVRAEHAAADADFRFRTLGENAPIGILMSEAGLRLAFANAHFAKVARMSIDDLLGTGWLSVFAEEDTAAIVDMAQGVLAGTASSMTVRLRRTDGKQRWVHVKLAPVVTWNRAAGFVGTVEDVTSRLSHETELKYQASHDALTGLANRRYLLSTLADLFDCRRREDRQFAVLFFDLDGFKEVNDHYGHDAGDRLLIEVARRMSSVAREDDLVGRLAGDEFVVVLRHISTLQEAHAAATRQLTELSREIRLGSSVVTVSASVGVALAQDHQSAEGILRAADSSMYEAKRASRPADPTRASA